MQGRVNRELRKQCNNMGARSSGSNYRDVEATSAGKALKQRALERMP